ncbi:hypothetical protein ONZ45_g9220 [Pleurotus djamor]|nr:hypothetical protein ONZ45_g9220 [Pleurotus djamor]
MERSRTDSTFSLDHSSDHGSRIIGAQTSTPPLVEEDGTRHGTFLSGIFTRDAVLSQPPSISVLEDLSSHTCGLSYSDVSDPPPRISPFTTRSNSIASGDCDTAEHGESPTVDTSLCDLPSIPDELASLLEDVFIGMHTFGVPRGCGSALLVNSMDEDEDMLYDSPPQPLPSTCSLILSPSAPRAGFDPLYHDFTVNLDDCDDSEGSPPQPLPSTCSLIDLSAPSYVTSTPHVRSEPGRFPSRGIFLKQSKAGHSLHNIHTSRHIQRELKDDYLQRDFESNLDLIHPLLFNPALELDSLDRHAMVQVEDLRTMEDSRQHTISPRSFEENITLALLDAMHSRGTTTDSTLTRRVASPVPRAHSKATATSKFGRKAKTLATSAKTLTKRALRGVFRFVA